MCRFEDDIALYPMRKIIKMPKQPTTFEMKKNFSVEANLTPDALYQKHRGQRNVPNRLDFKKFR